VVKKKKKKKKKEKRLCKEEIMVGSWLVDGRGGE
jgi:hypothetical protein